MADIYQIIENNGTPKSIEDRKARTNIAPYFNVNNANAVGDLILSDTGTLFKFNSAYSAGTSWNSRTSKEEVNIDDELKNRVNQINSSISTINSNINAIDSSLAIVSDGDTHVALTTGQYVYVKNHSSLAEGLYTANSSIATNVALTSSNVTRVQENGADIGGFNKLNNKINSFSIHNFENTTTQITPGESWYSLNCSVSGKKMIALAGFGVWYPLDVHIANISLTYQGTVSIYMTNSSNVNRNGFNISGLYINS